MSKRVLIVEDDPDVVGFLEAFLTVEGFDVEAAEDGLVGLLKLQTSPPDIAVVDVMMPDVDGVRVLEQLFEEGKGRLPVPVVVITGSPEGAARCRALLGSADVITKPIDPALLLERIHAHLPAIG